MIGGPLLDRSVDELAGALFVALLATGAMTLCYAAARRKSSDPLTLLAAFGLLANVVSMAVVAGHVAPRAGGDHLTRLAAPAGLSPPVFTSGPPHEELPQLAARLVAFGDADGDGRLTGEEALGAVERLFPDAARGATKGLDTEGLNRAVFREFGPVPGFPNPGAPH